MALTKSQIGRCGELLVQYRLLKLGIESAPMTTDSGVDLVAYAPASGRPATIQVKTNLRAKPGGVRARPDWIGGCQRNAQLGLLRLLTYLHSASGYSKPLNFPASHSNVQAVGFTFTCTPTPPPAHERQIGFSGG